MKNKKYTWLSLILFSVCAVMVFTASECEGTVEEEINTNIEFSFPYFDDELFGVTFNGTYIAVGGHSYGGGVGVIIKRQPL
jgi:hypothetical protein